MINYLRGKIVYRDDKSLVLENQGVGFKIFVSPETLKNISENEEVRLFTHLYLREESVEFYGFLTPKELELFEILNDISGIGPKTAMMLASLGSLEKLKEIMEKGELPPEIKGIGKKRAQKILLELTGKIKEIKKPFNADEVDGTMEILVSLGFSRQRAKEVLSEIPTDLNQEERVKKALKALGR